MTGPVQVEVADWELQCCGGPLLLGDRVDWALLFSPATAEAAGSPVDAVWTVSELPAPGPGWSARLLDAGALRATWIGQGAPPPTGVHRLPGRLTATWHGGISDDELATTSARVERIQVVRRRWDHVAVAPPDSSWIRFSAHGGRTFAAVPGSVQLRDVDTAPDGLVEAPDPRRRDTSYRTESGWLVDLRITS